MTADRVPRAWAIHEAAHVVACWATQRWLGRDWIHVNEVVVRTPAEMRAEPVLYDRRGRSVTCSGFADIPDHYKVGITRRMTETRLPENPTPQQVAWLQSMPDVIRKSLEADVVQCLAGPAAEARQSRRARAFVMLAYGFADWNAATEKIRDFCGDDEVRYDALLNEFGRRARTIVSEHWSRINSLADALQTRRRLDGIAATRIVEGRRRSRRPPRRQSH